MQQLAKFSLLAAAAMLTVALIPNLHAADWDKKTKLTVNEPIEVPGAILQPGNYVLKLVESESNRHVVRFMNEEEDEVISTVLAIPNTRLEPTGDTEFGWYETPANQPPAMRAWFYPGDNFGQEFVYDDNRAQTLAATTQPAIRTPQVSSQVERDQQLAQQQQSDQQQLAQQQEQAREQEQARLQQQREQQERDQQQLAQQQERARQQEQARQEQQQRREQQLAEQQRAREEQLAQQQRAQQEQQDTERLMAQNQDRASTSPQTSATQLPETAGAATLLGLVGLASLVGSFGIGAIRRRRD